MKPALQFIVALLLFATPLVCQSQTQFMNDGNQRPLYWGSTYVVEGSPYLYHDYKWARITGAGGKVYDDLRIKFNMQTMEIQYILDDGREMVSSTLVKSIRFLKASISGDSLADVLIHSAGNVLNTNGASVYESVCEGKVSLWKKIALKYRDEKRYSEATTTRIFTTEESYYIRKDSSAPAPLDKSREFITALINDHQKETEEFIRQHKIKFRSVADIRELINYYNGLNP